MPKANRPRRASQLLQDSALAAGARRVQPATETPESGPDLAALLPEAVRGHVDAVLEDGTLVLLARNSAVAQLLRFHGPRMARQLGAHNWLVRVSAHADGTQPALPRRPAPRLPDSAARCLRETAAGIEDPALREALERLARNGE